MAEQDRIARLAKLIDIKKLFEACATCSGSLLLGSASDPTMLHMRRKQPRSGQTPVGYWSLRLL